MTIFITGATGWIGSAVTDELLAHGHDVTGLARSQASADALEAKGARVHRGSLDDPESLAAAARVADGVIHLAFKHDFDDYAGAGRTEHAVVSAMLESLAGSGRPFLLAASVAGLGTGRPGTEEDASPFHGPDSLRGGGENLALSYADRGVHPVVLRLPPSVHGTGDHGFVATLTAVARERGIAAYVGDGASRWSAVHVDDAARLVRLALEKAAPGARVHAVGEEGIPTRELAAALGDHLGLPTGSVGTDEVEEHFGWIGRFLAMDLSATAARTRRDLGWTPTGPTLISDIANGAYDGA